MKQDRNHHVVEGHPFFTSREKDGVLHVEFSGEAEDVLGIRLKAIQQLHELLSRQKKNPSKAVIFNLKSDTLSPERITKMLSDYGLNAYGAQQESPAGVPPKARPMDLIRAMNSAQSLIQGIQTIDAFVVMVVSGEMPLALFGTALACDHRIAPEDFMLINRIPQTGFTPFGGLPWFLTRTLGRNKARDILMNHETISACKALELGLIDRIVHKERLMQEAIATAKHVASLPWGCRVGLKRALSMTDLPLGKYLEAEANVFDRSLEKMKSSTKLRSLENVT
jgi:enoyl-CoA hydratase/carnithine racemase